MGGFFGITSKEECLQDVFFGVDYHSHLGTRRAGLAVYDKEIGLQRKLHSIENSPFRTRFENVFDEMHGTAAVGCISNTDPQPLLIRAKGGTFALCTTGIVNNTEALIDDYLEKDGGHFDSMTGGKVNTTELLAALISREDTLVQGIKAVQQAVDGTVGIVLLKDDGTILAARDKMGRLPMLIGKREDGYCVTFESFAAIKLGFEIIKELGAGEIVELSPSEMKILVEPSPKKKVCAFLWSYYGYPTATYEGVNVEAMRVRNGALMAKSDRENGLAQEIDYVCGIPDSGVPHAIGYANQSHKPFAWPFVKYTPTWPRSFTPTSQKVRNQVAKMKQIPVPELIQDKKLLFVDDSIVRGTQLRETVEFLYESGAKEVHMRSACPPIMYGCKYLNFSRSKSEMELLARQIVRELEGEEGDKHLEEYADPTTERGQAMLNAICKEMGFDSLGYQTLDGLLEAIGIDRDKVCTYCWTGRE